MFVLLFQNSQGVNPKDSFAWKDKSLDLELKALRDARFVAMICHDLLVRAANITNSAPSIFRSKKVETRDGGHVFDQGIQGSLASWNKLPKAPDQEVILLKKARGEICKVDAPY